MYKLITDNNSPLAIYRARVSSDVRSLVSWQFKLQLESPREEKFVPSAANVWLSYFQLEVYSGTCLTTTARHQIGLCPLNNSLKAFPKMVVPR